MSDVLQRLVGRATGEVAGGLRPRRPSRFESTLRETARVAVNAEAGAPPAAAPDRVRRDDPGPTPARGAEPVPAIATAAPRPPAAPPASTPAPGDPTAPPADRNAPTQGGRRRAADPQSPPPPAAAPLADPRTDEPAGTRGHPGAPPPRPGSATPPPLLPPRPLPGLAEDFRSALGPAPPPPETSRTRGPETEPSPPDVTIHIGQLDVRSEAPPARRPARDAAGRAGLPSLADYLRGGRS